MGELMRVNESMTTIEMNKSHLVDRRQAVPRNLKYLDRKFALMLRELRYLMRNTVEGCSCTVGDLIPLEEVVDHLSVL